MDCVDAGAAGSRFAGEAAPGRQGDGKVSGEFEETAAPSQDIFITHLVN
jgi:hypothetical protein